MARPRIRTEDDDSDEINRYAMFMGYLSMAINGLGFLILTWTTVVLLGGFVSALQNKDFWCLTFITLAQTAGIFDVYLNEKLSYMLYSAYGMVAGSMNSILSENKKMPEKMGYRYVAACVFIVVQALVLAILLCPLAAVYVFGLLISTGISLWRLMQHDYGSNSDEQANLKPAMDTLYCIALLQGVIFLYRFIFARAEKRFVRGSIDTCGDDEHDAILTYLQETRIGCEKNPSFVRGRSFATYAIELMGSKSLDAHISGIQLLYTTICIQERRLKVLEKHKDNERWYRGRWKQVIEERSMMKYLITSASSSPVVQKVLLETLNPRANERETRNQAAKIVAQLALHIHLEKFPREIQYISTLIGTFEEYRLINAFRTSNIESDQEGHGKLVLRGLCILRKLALDENNCRIMSETQVLLSRIMSPLTSDLIHQFNGGTWSISVVEGSLKVMGLLVAAPGETGARMRREVSKNMEAVHTMERIIGCDYCHVKLQKQAIGILIPLYMDTKSRSTFIKMLVDIFVAASNNTDWSIRNLAGEALAKLCFQSESNTSIIIHVNGDVVGSLTKILLYAENKTCKIRAAEILEHICNIHHTQDDECIGKIKEAMTTTMQKVLAQILDYDLTNDETPTRPEPGQLEFLITVDTKNPSSAHPEYKEGEEEVDMDAEFDEYKNKEDEEFRAPLLSFCVTVWDTFISDDQDLACQFDAISLPMKLKELVEEHSVLTVHCLKLMKLTCKMVISMMKHSGNYIKEDLDGLINALSSASKSMCHLDASMVFANEDDGATTKLVRSLVSLVKEAKGSVETRRATEAHESWNPLSLVLH